MPWHQLPNAITVLRILLTLPFAWALLSAEFGLALALFIIAGISDGLDGWLAKHFHWQSRFGAIADPLADKLLLLAGFSALSWLGQLPFWLWALVLGRDLLIVGGALVYHRLFGPYEMQPSLLSKLNTLLQILLVAALLLRLAGFALPQAAADILLALVVLTTLASGADYVWRWSWRCAQGLRQRRGER